MRELHNINCQYVFWAWVVLHESIGAQEGPTFWETPG